LNKQITLAGAELKIESQQWKGGELGVTAGGVEIDLRYARLDPEGALLDVRIVMGGVDIRVPDTWQIRCDVTPFLGGADDSTRSTQGSTSVPVLRVVGSVTLGGLSIHN
jgi:predicted membrane protein